MSYDVSLAYTDGRPCTVTSHKEGGTYVRGGGETPYLNVTYNYAPIYSQHGFSIRDMDGKRAGDTIQTISRVVDRLDVDRDPDYWKPTEGNARHAVSILLAWARQHPDAIWDAS